jgi:hypothetical protein
MENVPLDQWLSIVGRGTLAVRKVLQEVSRVHTAFVFLLFISKKKKTTALQIFSILQNQLI